MISYRRPTSLLAAFIVWTSLPFAAASDRPNLVIVLADDLSQWDASVYGGQAATPHLEALAQEGMTFSKAFQAAPMCSPTRHALYTGLYPVESGAWPNHTFVYEGVRSIAHYLQDAGYRAALSGKTHINPPEAFPFEYLTNGAKSNNPDFAAVDAFLGECAANNQPFGLILCSNEPHTPWDKGDASRYPPEKLKLPPLFPDTPSTRENFSRYLAEITYFDDQVGEAMSLLERHGLKENTLVVALTEQGNAFPFAKWTCYDIGLGSGMITRWPGVVDPGSASDALVEYIDILPTFLDAAGIVSPEGLAGRSFRPVLEGTAAKHKDVVFGLQTSVGINHGPGPYGIRSARDARYRYIRNLNPETAFSNWPTQTDWWQEWETAAHSGEPIAVTAVERYVHRTAEELYDCEVDPWNRYNLADNPTYDAVKHRLAQQLDDWMAAQGDQGEATEKAAESRLWKNRDRSN